MSVAISPSAAVTDVTAWEAAYSRFETAEEEVEKFANRLQQLGALSWDRASEIVELFCGRGNGLVALHRWGFTRIEGVDLSASLLAQYRGPARCHVGDCRALPFDDDSKDIVIIQGGLHHLHNLPHDLDQCLREIHRVLKPSGKVVIVEPWHTPFLSVVHWLCGLQLARHLWPKLDALAIMIEHEHETYHQWLSQPQALLCMLDEYFVPGHRCRGWGKLMFLGSKRVCIAGPSRVQEMRTLS